MIQLNLLILQLLNFFHGFTAHITQYTYNIQYLATKSRGSSYFKNNFINMLSDVERNTPHCTLNADTEEKSRLLVFSMEAGLTMIIFNS